MAKRAEPARRRRAKRWSDSEARGILREWQQSGLSASAFARRRGITATRLSYWRERLGKDSGSRDEVGFVAVPLSGSEFGRGAQVELECAGVTVRVRDFDVEQLARLIVTLSRRVREC